MRGAASPATSRRYPLTMICAVYRVPRSSVYAATAPAPGAPAVPGKRGPKTITSDGALVAAIREVLATTPFHGEGHRKVRRYLGYPQHEQLPSTRCPRDRGRYIRVQFPS